MQRSLLFLLVSLGFFLASCSSTPQKWYKPGATSHHFEHDKSDCEDAVLSSGTSTLSNAQTYSFQGCMEGKGWTVLADPS